MGSHIAPEQGSSLASCLAPVLGASMESDIAPVQGVSWQSGGAATSVAEIRAECVKAL